MNKRKLIQEIETIFSWLSYHRDQQGQDNDERCVLDDTLLYYWTLHPHGNPVPVPPWSELESQCVAHCMNRQGFFTPADRKVFTAKKREDIYSMSTPKLFGLRLRLRIMIWTHKLLGTQKTYVHDILLYQEIPDGFIPDIQFAPAHVRLPNCQSFCTKNQGQDVRYMNQWVVH